VIRKHEAGIGAYLLATAVAIGLGTLVSGGWADAISAALLIAYVPLLLLALGAVRAQWAAHRWRTLVPPLLVIAGVPAFLGVLAAAGRAKHRWILRDMPAYERALTELAKDSSFQSGSVPDSLLPLSASLCLGGLTAGRDSNGQIAAGCLVGRAGGYVYDRAPPVAAWSRYAKVAPHWYWVTE
jgi:hypothetical protein